MDEDDQACGGDEGLIAWWQFDEGSGTTTVDSSGNGNDAQLVSLGWTSGYLGYSPDFDGAGYVPGTDLDEIAIADEMTVALWIKLYDTDRTGARRPAEVGSRRLPVPVTHA